MELEEFRTTLGYRFTQLKTNKKKQILRKSYWKSGLEGPEAESLRRLVEHKWHHIFELENRR